jgi:hypothetical protein
MEVPGQLSIGGCRPVPLTLMTDPDGQDLIQFGEVVSAQHVLCVHPATGQVVDMILNPGGAVLRRPAFVNSRLDRYIATVREATARFPYDDGSDGIDFGPVADELRRHLEPIDPPAWVRDQYWDTLYWDVAIGDYYSGDFANEQRR